MLAADAPRPHRIATVLLGALILIGSLTLVAIPIGWIWLLAQLGQPYLAVYFLALGGCPIMMIAWGLGLLRLNAMYSRLGGGGEQTGELLELGIAISVVVAVAILAAWLFLFPSGGGPVEGPWPG